MDGEAFGRFGLSVAVLGLLTALFTAAMAAIGVPTWAWIALILWALLALTAAVVQSEPKGRAYLQATLKHPRYTQVYLSIARPVNDWVWRRVGVMQAGPDGTERPLSERLRLPALLRGALTWRLVDRALLLAVLYPIVALLVPWLLGGDAVLGQGVVVLPAADFWPERAVMLGQFAIVAAGVVGQKLASASPKRFWRRVSGCLPGIAVAVAVALALALAFAAAVAVAVALAFAFAFAVAVALAFAVAGAVAFAFAVAVAFAVAFAVEALWDKKM